MKSIQMLINGSLKYSEVTIILESLKRCFLQISLKYSDCIV